MPKMKRKYTSPHTYTGAVDSRQATAKGRTKREATKRLRRSFAEQGVHTQPDAMTDLLAVAGSGGGFRQGEPARLTGAERRERAVMRSLDATEARNRRVQKVARAVKKASGMTDSEE
jgi:hypothetical protein